MTVLAQSQNSGGQVAQSGQPLDMSPSSDGLDPVVVTGARYVLQDLSPSTFYAHFLDGTGTTVVLTGWQFHQVANLGKVVTTAPNKDGSYAQLRSYYGLHDSSGSNLGLTFGSAVLDVDDNGFPLGFSDFYDFDFHSRESWFAQFMTGVGATGYLVGGKDFAITYP
jgi:hypothetical protein